MIIKKINKKSLQLPKNLVNTRKIIQIFMIVHNLKNNNYCLEVGCSAFWVLLGFFALVGMIIMLFSAKYLKPSSLNENASQHVCFTDVLISRVI